MKMHANKVKISQFSAVIIALSLIEAAGCGGGGSAVRQGATTPLAGDTRVYGSVSVRAAGTPNDVIEAQGEDGVTFVGVGGTRYDRIQATVPDLLDSANANGPQLLYTASVNGTIQTLIRNADGTGTSTFVNGPNGEGGYPLDVAYDRYGGEAVTLPQLSPDGTRVLYVAPGTSGDTNDKDIYLANADGTGTPTNLSQNAARDDSPQWSANGKKVVWLRRVYRSDVPEQGGCGGAVGGCTPQPGTELGGGPYYQSVMVRDVQTFSPEVSLSPLGGAAESFPVLSPDGTHAAWIGTRNFNPDVLTRPTDGSTPEVTLNGSTPVYPVSPPAFSPNGNSVAWGGFNVVPIGQRSAGTIWARNADGSGELRLVTQDTNALYPAYHFAPAWSPDGTRIAYIRSGDVTELLVKNADGTGSSSQIAHSPSIYLTGAFAPSWSPDGTLLACSEFGSLGVYSVTSPGRAVALPTVPDNQFSIRDVRFAGFIPTPQTAPSLFRRARPFVGDNGYLETTAVGFLNAYQNDTLKSVLVFDAQKDGQPSTAVHVNFLRRVLKRPRRSHLRCPPKSMGTGPSRTKSFLMAFLPGFRF